VDHERRRRELADAALSVVRNSGLDGLTVRGVAAEAGWSTGALAHYFNSKDALLQAAHQRVIERIFERARKAESSSSPLARFREFLLAALPLDDERHAELTVWFAFVARALARSDFAEQQRAGHRFWVSEIERHIVQAQAAGEVPATKDAGAAAEELAVFLDGLAQRGCLFRGHGMTAADLVALLDTQLAHLARPVGPR
jgi:AcrR family transcriptional regulator